MKIIYLLKLNSTLFYEHMTRPVRRCTKKRIKLITQMGPSFDAKPYDYPETVKPATRFLQDLQALMKLMSDLHLPVMVICSK
jgi:hypothetical protein